MAVKLKHIYLRKLRYNLLQNWYIRMIKDRLLKNQQPCNMSSKITIAMKNIQYLIALYYPYIPNVYIIHDGFKKRNIPHKLECSLLDLFSTDNETVYRLLTIFNINIYVIVLLNELTNFFAFFISSFRTLDKCYNFCIFITHLLD